MASEVKKGTSILHFGPLGLALSHIRSACASRPASLDAREEERVRQESAYDDQIQRAEEREL